jgi:hypothetical protein
MIKSTTFLLLAALVLMVSGQSINATSNCTVSYRLYDTDTNSYFNTLLGEDNISYPPCNINIEALVNCTCPFDGEVRMTLRTARGSLVKRKREQFVPYFLYGDVRGNVRSARLDGQYTIQSIVADIETPPVSFTMYPCVPQ